MLMLSLSTSGPIASAAVIKDGQVLSPGRSEVMAEHIPRQ